MRTAVLAYAALLTVELLAQDCSYERNEVDAFTKHRVVITEAPWPKGALIDKVAFRRVDDQYYLDLGYNPGRVCGIAEGANMMFILAGDTVVTLPCVKGDVTSVRYSTSGNIYRIEPTFSTTKDQLALISARPLNRVRIYYTEGYEDKDVSDKPKKQEKIMSAAKCLLAVE